MVPPLDEQMVPSPNPSGRHPLIGSAQRMWDREARALPLSGHLLEEDRLKTIKCLFVQRINQHELPKWLFVSISNKGHCKTCVVQYLQP